MADETILIDIEYNTDEAEKEVDSLTESIEGLKVEQSRLNQQLKDGSVSQTEYSKEAAKLSVQIQQQNKDRKDLIKLQQAENNSRKKLTAQIGRLIKERDNLNTSTEEGAKRSKELETQINSLNDSLVDSATKTQKNKLEIGNYEESIINAVNALRKQESANIENIKALNEQKKALANDSRELVILNSELAKNQKELSTSQTELKKYGQNIDKADSEVVNLSEDLKDSSKGQDGFIGGMKGMIKSSLAFIATPLGAVLAAIVGVFKLLQKAFQRSEGSMNKLRAVTGRLSGVFSLLMKGLEPVVDFIIDNVIATFDALGNAVDKTLGFVSRALGKLGFDQAAESVDNFNTKLKESSAAGEALAVAQAKLTEALRFAEKTQLDFQKLAERQRQIRDDEAISIEKRIAANNELNTVLGKQMAAEMAIAQQSLNVANMRIALEGDSTAALDERAEALTKISEIQERIESQASEQLVNTNSLIRDQTALRKEAIELEKAAAAEKQELINFERELELEQEAEDKALLLEINKEYDDALVESNQAAKEQIIEDDKAAAQQRMDIAKAAIQATDQLAGQSFQFLKDLNSKRFDSKLASLEKENLSEVEFTRRKEKLERDFAKKSQRIAIAQAISKAALVILNASLTQPYIPAGLAASAAAAISTGIQIATIKNAKFAKGGVVPLAKNGMKMGTFSGPSHSQGGIPIVNGLTGRPIANVEGNENFYVVNKQASAHINSISDINQRIGGGVPLSNKSQHMADGGRADIESSQGSFNINDITKEVVDRLPPIIVRTEDIKTGVQDYDDVVNVGVV